MPGYMNPIPERQSRFPNPPKGLVLCGGEGWERMSDEAREEIWLMDEYLSTGGKRAHGSFEEYRNKRQPSFKLRSHSEDSR